MMRTLSHHVLREHVVIGGIGAVMLLPWLGRWGSLVFWLSNILIDLDHFGIFLYLTGFRLSYLSRLMRFYEKIFEQRNRIEFLTVEFFHTAEFLFFFGVLVVFWFPHWLPVLLGFLFHVGVDFIHLMRFSALGKRSHTLVGYFWRRRQLEAAGKNPDAFFREILSALELQNRT